MERVLVWGIGEGYQRICNALKWNEEIGNFEMTACVSKDYGAHSFDGKTVVRPEKIQEIVFDYIIVSAEKYYEEIVAYGVEVLKIDRSRFLHGKVFEIPCFDWKRYLEIYRSNISIVAELCYGGVLSHHLGLPFNSPFVNVRVGDKTGYQKMLGRLDYYMSTPPELKENGDRGVYLEGCVEYPLLWYDDIVLHGFHYRNVEDFFSKWEKRRKRYNPNSNIVFRILYGENDLEEFDRLAIKNKVGFYYENTDMEQVITVPFDQYHFTYAFSTCVLKFIETGSIFREANIFKLLLGEKDFKR